MEILILSHTDVEELLSMQECIDTMSEVLSSLTRGEIYNPLRSAIQPPGASGLLSTMPAYRSGKRAAYVLKEVCVFPSNPEKGLDAHQGAVLLHSAETGQLMAVMNASVITSIRTAAVSGLATTFLAREEASELAIVGTGVQARKQLEAMSLARNFSRVRVVDLHLERAREFASECRGRYNFSIEPTVDVESAVKDADVIVTVTNASEPVLQRDWIRAGVHINAIGSSVSTAREIDTATMKDSRLFVDRRESTLNESGDYLFAAKEGAIGPDHIQAELGEILVGEAKGRQTAEEITLFKSLGIAAEDLAAAQYLYDKALAEKKGSRVVF